MHIAGYIALLLGLISSTGAGGLALLQLWEGKDNYLALVRKLSWLVTGSLVFACAALLHALYWQDYSFDYVASYTDKYLPLFYRLTAFWAGQPGSLLFWATVSAICGWLWNCSSFSSAPAKKQLWFWSLFQFIMAFFCLLLISYSNPFLILNPAPADGNGLNPLLQNPGMIIHPPLLFLGYALFTVPTCLCLAQILSGEESPHVWFMASRPYLLAGWLFLTAGIIIGAWWAYMELGWGGYWAWDPVENASLLPWLSSTALLHLLVIERKTRQFYRSSSFLMALTLILTFFGTLLTRSGIIESVHAFSDGGVGLPLLCFVIFLTLISLSAIFASPIKLISSESFTPRSASIVLSVWILLALTFIIILATLWPVLSQMSSGLSQGLDPAFYNRVCLPILAILIGLLCVCRCLPSQWIIPGKWNLIKLIIIFSAFICSCAIIRILDYTKILPLLAAGASCAAVMAVILEIFQKSWYRSPIKISALGAHAGAALIALGISFSGPYTQEYELVLKQGETANAGNYTVTLEKISDGSNSGYDFLKADCIIKHDNKVVGILSPERRIYEKYGTMQFSEVDVISSFSKDLYASLIGMDEEHNILIKLSIEPLVNLIWAGGFLMCLIPLAGLRKGKSSGNKS